MTDLAGGPKLLRRPMWRRLSIRSSERQLGARLLESACMLAAATIVYLVIGETAIRISLRVPLFAWHDFRHEGAASTINKAVQYDALLGWRLKPHLRSPGFNTLDYGFRSSGDPDAKVKPGGVLALGSSFTAGSEVNDDQSWPAHLQQLTGWNVNNAGQGGYQADQIALFAEQLLPLVRPQVVVIDLIPGTIIGTGYASFGWRKPYFTIENGELILHRPPEPQGEPAAHSHFDAKKFLGHFAVVNRFMVTFFSDFWFKSEVNDFATVSTDELAVTCRLLERIKQQTDASRTRLILYLQYGGLEIADASRTGIGGSAHNAAAIRYFKFKRWVVNQVKPYWLGTPPGAPDWYQASLSVGQCARHAGITTVDELASLAEVYGENPADLRKYYQIEPDGSLGHKSSFGNSEVAKLVAAAIGELVPPADLYRSR
jgi:hypothetical protein